MRRSTRRVQVAGILASAFFSWTEAGGEMNSAHIPPAPDPALSRPSPREYQGFEIHIAPMVAIPVRMPMMLKNACRTYKEVWACTFFAAERLTCRCVERDQRWRLDARVEFVPVMYYRDRRFEQHERKHLEHVTGMLSAYLRKLVSRDFASRTACAAAADQEMSAFLNLMNEFREASNRELH